MDKIFNYIKENRYFLIFIIFFSYAQSIKSRMGYGKELDIYVFTPEAAIWTFLNSCILFLIIIFFIRIIQKSVVFNYKEIIKIFCLSIISNLIVIKLFGLIISLIFNTFDRNFNTKTFLLSTFSDFINSFIYGSFFLVYSYFEKNKNYQQKLQLYQEKNAKQQISQLKSQLNPHFLFNNLNVLDQLIEEDKQKASNFLNEFSEIYRYVLRSIDINIVSVNEEIVFIQSYINLIQYKFGNAYVLKINPISSESGHLFPMSLQLLVENAIQHNLGSEKDPIVIDITVGKLITISNNIIAKRYPRQSSGKGLNNLEKQYEILTGKKIEIKKSETEFTVRIPII